MREHDSLGIPSGTTSVHDVAAHSWSLVLNLSFNHWIVDLRAHFNHLLPVDDTESTLYRHCLFLLFSFLDSLLLSIYNDGFNPWKQVFDGSNLLIISFHCITYYYLSFTVLNLLCAGFRSISDIDFSENTVREDGTHQTHEMFRWIMTQETYSRAFSRSQDMESFRKLQRSIVELSPGIHFNVSKAITL